MKASVAELRNVLVQSGKFTQDEADNIKGKAKLVEEIQKLEGIVRASDEEVLVDSNLQEIFQEAEPEISGSIMHEKPISDSTDVLGYNDPRWHDFVMQHFDASELDNGCPKLDGLRRVAQLLLGEIVESGPINIVSPIDGNAPGRATVVYSVLIAWKLDMSGELRRFSATGGSWHGNTDYIYAAYPEAMAENRAEARALRRALRLKVVSADEKTSKNTEIIVKESTEKKSPEWTDNGIISPGQIKFIQNMCVKLGIDVDKFINQGEAKFVNMEEIPKQLAVEMIGKLNQYQSSTKSSLVIPNEIKLVK